MAMLWNPLKSQRQAKALSQPAPRDAALRAPSDRKAEPSAGGRRLRWTLVMTWFMRVLSILWIMKGLSAWAVILGVWTPIGHFESRSTGYQATIVYFSLIDLIAAVGLWMASTWGGVMWLLAVMSHLILAAFFPGIVSGGVVTVGLFLTLVAIYLAVACLAAREG